MFIKNEYPRRSGEPQVQLIFILLRIGLAGIRVPFCYYYSRTFRILEFAIGLCHGKFILGDYENKIEDLLSLSNM
jgi:hypothetical protein